MQARSLFIRLTPVGIFLIIAGFFAYGLTRDPSKIPTEMIDRELPSFELPSLYDQNLMLNDETFLGKTHLVNVFGSWCVACLQEHPTLMRLSRAGRINLVGVNWRDDRADALAWLQRHRDPFQQIIYDADSELAIELGVTGAPETFIIDPRGRIRFKYVGPITDRVYDETIEPVLKAIEAEGGTGS